MTKVFACCASLLITVPGFAVAADFSGNGTTILRIEERSIPGLPKEHLVPATQYVGIDADGMADGNLSLHLYGWGRHDFADTSASDKKNDGELSYGYLRYRFPKSNAEMKAGRFFVNAGVAHEQMDGLFAQADMVYGLTATIFGGAPVRLSNDNRGDYLLGGRVAYRSPGWLEIGASMLDEKGAVSQRYVQGAVPPVIQGRDYRQLVGADIWLSAGNKVELTGLTSYSSSASAIAEHNYLLQIRPVRKVTMAGSYTQRFFKGYFSGTNLPNLFRPDSLDDSAQYGGSVTYEASAPVEVTVDYRHIRRATLGGTDRYGIETRLLLDAISSRAGLGYHRYAAPDVATPAVILASYNLSFHEIRAWILYDHERYLLSLDMIGHFYDDGNNPNLNGRSSDYEAALSAGYRVLQNVTVSADLSYGANALLQEEFKAIARAEFAFSIAGKGGKR